MLKIKLCATFRAASFRVFALPFLFSIFIPQSAHGDAPPPFRIGVVVALTGAAAEIGIATKNGIELARLEHPENFSRIETIYEDSNYDPKSAATAFSKLQSVDHCNLLFVWGTGMVNAVAPIAQSNRVPMVGVTAERQVSVDRNYVIRFHISGQQFASALKKYFRSKGYSRIGLFETENAFLNTVADGLQEDVLAGEKVDVVGRFQPSESDFKPSILSLKAKSYDAIGVLLINGQITPFYRQAAALKFGSPTFGTHFFESKAELSQSSGMMNGAVFASTHVSDDFRRRYTQKFSNDSQIEFAGNGYDFAMLAAKLFSDLKAVPSGEEILSALAAVPPQIGVTGPFEYKDSAKEGKAFVFPVVLKRVEGDKVVELGDGS